MAFCSQCGIKVENDAKFCPGCGNPCNNSPRSDLQLPDIQQPINQQPIVENGSPVVKTVKGASKFAKIAKWLIPIILVVAAAVAAFFIFDLGKFFKSDEDLIRERIEAYEDACNDGDYEAMLDCMDNQTKVMLDGTMNVMDGLFSEGTGLGFGISDMFGVAGAMGDFISIEITDIKIDGDKAIASIVMKTNLYGMIQSSDEAELPMVKEDGDWYIGGVENTLLDGMLGF